MLPSAPLGCCQVPTPRALFSFWVTAKTLTRIPPCSWRFNNHAVIQNIVFINAFFQDASFTPHHSLPWSYTMSCDYKQCSLLHILKFPPLVFESLDSKITSLVKSRFGTDKNIGPGEGEAGGNNHISQISLSVPELEPPPFMCY